MISAVLDANIIASGILGLRTPDSIPGMLLRLWFKGAFTLITSEHLRNEVKNTLQKPYFKAHLSAQEISRVQAILRFRTKQASITQSLVELTTHPEDDLILATAVSAKANYLVTGDKPLLKKVGSNYKGVTLITSSDFLKILKSS